MQSTCRELLAVFVSPPPTYSGSSGDGVPRAALLLAAGQEGSKLQGRKSTSELSSAGPSEGPFHTVTLPYGTVSQHEDTEYVCPGPDA